MGAQEIILYIGAAIAVLLLLLSFFFGGSSSSGLSSGVDAGTMASMLNFGHRMPGYAFL